jgi:divalent metal cation (Fe/Co/Zn/Cd) transporter
MAVNISSHRDRASTARHGYWLEVLTIAWAVLEASVALLAAKRSASLSLAGFGFDSLIEVVSGAALTWRMSHENDPYRRHRAERVSLRIAGVCLLTLGTYVFLEASLNLIYQKSSETSWIGMCITAAALVLMPLLSHAKRQVGRALNSEAMMTDARQTDFCAYQAAIVLFGLLVHAISGIGWADSVAALIMVPLLFRAGVLSIRGEACCTHHPHLLNPAASIQ